MKTSQKYVYDIGAGGLKNTKTGKVNIFNEENATVFARSYGKENYIDE